MQSNLPDEYKEQVDILNESEEHMLSVVNHILDYAKIESGKVYLNNQKFSINDLVNKINAIFSLKIKSKNIIFVSEIDKNLPEFSIGDSDKISQILSNLLDNAFKFTQIGKICLKVSLLQHIAHDNYILFDVTDTGIGLQSSAISRLFTPHLQEAAGNNLYSHTGLGLAISKNLVDILGGTIHAESLTDGSRFYFTVPLITCEETKTVRAVMAEKLIESKTDKTYLSDILLVEDNQLNQRTLQIVLDKFGFTVTIASDGHKALELYSKHTFHVILMDCQMPHMDGYTTSIEIRKIEYGTSHHTPIIGVTAHADPANRQRCLDVGMDDFVTKPLNIDEFHLLLNHYINK